MKKFMRYVAVVVVLCVWTTSATWAGMIQEDPLYFSPNPPKVIFPGADVKLVTFEFEAIGNDDRGKRVAKELHDQFLKEIHDLQGGAIITFVAPPGKRLANYRIEAVEVAKGQAAQMVLWGRIALDQAGTPLINARLELIQPPSGISASYGKMVMLKSGAPIPVEGRLVDYISQVRINFHTLERDVTSLANFLSGLSRYYKGMKKPGVGAKRWLESSAKDFDEYIKAVPEEADRVALGIAHTYLARAYFGLSEVDSVRSVNLLDQAKNHAERAAKLSPYDPDIPAVQAVIAAKQNAKPQELREYIVKAATLAPGDSNVRINLALVESASGNFDQAIQQLDTARFLNKAQAKDTAPDIRRLRSQLSRVQERVK